MTKPKATRTRKPKRSIGSVVDDHDAPEAHAAEGADADQVEVIGYWDRKIAQLEEHDAEHVPELLKTARAERKKALGGR